MKHLFLGMAAILFFCSFALAGSNSVAIVKHVKGEVKIKRAGETLAAKAGDHLQSGDLLITGGQGLIGIIFHDGSVLTLGRNSILQIEKFIFDPIAKKFNFNLRMKKGSALFESGKIGHLSPGKFHFVIPQGTIGIRGTKFLAEVR